MIVFLKTDILVSDSIEAAAENDLYNKELAYDKLRFDENGEEIIYNPETNGGYKLGPPPEKYRFKFITNNHLPDKYGMFELIDVPNKNKKGKVTDKMVYDQRTGKLALFPRRNSFEVVFHGELIYSRYDLVQLLKPNTEQEWPESYDRFAQRILDLANKSNPYKFFVQVIKPPFKYSPSKNFLGNSPNRQTMISISPLI